MGTPPKLLIIDKPASSHVECQLLKVQPKIEFATFYKQRMMAYLVVYHLIVETDYKAK